jgi:hypothetical protein
LLSKGSSNALVAPELTHVYTMLDNASVNTHSHGNGWNRPIIKLLVEVVSRRFASSYKRPFTRERKSVVLELSLVNEDSFVGDFTS